MHCETRPDSYQVSVYKGPLTRIKAYFCLSVEVRGKVKVEEVHRTWTNLLSRTSY